jgi:hypothetical protein
MLIKKAVPADPDVLRADEPERRQAIALCVVFGGRVPHVPKVMRTHGAW